MITSLDKNTALIVIDLQKGIAQGDLVTPAETVIANSIKLINAFHARHLPVVLVNVNPLHAQWIRARVDRPGIPREMVEQGEAKLAEMLAGYSDLIPELPQHPDTIYITKEVPNAFFKTPLHDALQERKVTGVVICGISTSIGVEGTLRAASELGYNVSIPADACSDRVPAPHTNSLENIFPRFAEVGTTEEVLNKLHG